MQMTSAAQVPASLPLAALPDQSIRNRMASTGELPALHRGTVKPDQHRQGHQDDKQRKLQTIPHLAVAGAAARLVAFLVACNAGVTAGFALVTDFATGLSIGCTAKRSIASGKTKKRDGCKQCSHSQVSKLLSSAGILPIRFNGKVPNHTLCPLKRDVRKYWFSCSCRRSSRHLVANTAMTGSLSTRVTARVSAFGIRAH
jgi:hypothetical protein